MIRWIGIHRFKETLNGGGNGFSVSGKNAKKK
jgi:hypothetical protein